MGLLKLLAVFAHPDDESMGMGGTLAKYSSEGVETHLVCASRGERGWAGPEQENPGMESLGRLRTQEVEMAVKELGMSGLSFLDYIDGEIDQADPSEITGRIVSHIRRIRPQVVVTFPPDGNYGHPDHIAIGQFTCAAIVCAADSSYNDPQGLPAFRASKLYFMVDSEDFVTLISSQLGDITFPVDDQIRGEVPWKEWMVTTRVEMADYCKTAWRAIHCHHSQLATLGPLAELDEDAGAAILAMQGVFYRVFSLVNGGRRVERDLFEGLR